MPPTPGSQNAVITGSSAKPTAGDLGMAGTLTGGTVIGMTTEFPFTHDVYHDRLMNRIVDIGYDWQMVINVDFQALKKSDADTPPTEAMMTVDPEFSSILSNGDARGFADITTGWAAGTQFMLTEGGGTFERNKPRVDKMKLEFRYYTVA